MEEKQQGKKISPQFVYSVLLTELSVWPVLAFPFVSLRLCVQLSQPQRLFVKIYICVIAKPQNLAKRCSRGQLTEF